MLELPPLSLYIHIPWCIKKCPYCDFNSHEITESVREKEYLAALIEDFEADAVHLQGREIQTVFIGGGTPSLLPARFYDDLFAAMRKIATFADNVECTLEANPGTNEAHRFSDYRSAGINRLSIGVQSFDNSSLSKLGRVHDADQARTAIDTCSGAGFDSFNLDLMYGLPSQDSDAAIKDLEIALSFSPSHLSWYQLTIEANTAFYSRPPVLPLEDSIMTMQKNGLALLESKGLKRYEVSAYSTAGNESRHNLNYWRFGDYIGIGAGAHGKITYPKQNRIVRTTKFKQPDTYLKQEQSRCAQKKQIDDCDYSIEFMMNALRLSKGFDEDLFERRTGNSFSEIAKKIRYLSSQGWLSHQAKQIIPTAKGQLFLDSLLQEFL
jgi:oxygen-independent coproporphyrinogen-3 oxidase